MIKLKTVKVKELKEHTFYVRYEQKIGLVLSIYLGRNKYGSDITYYFYDCVGLLGEKGYIYDNQDWELQYLIEKVFERKLDTKCLSKYKNNLSSHIFESPMQYQLNTNVDYWYAKSRLLDNTLDVINETLTIDSKDYIQAVDLREGMVYVKNSSKLYYYLGNNVKELKSRVDIITYCFIEIDIIKGDNFTNNPLGVLRAVILDKVPKLVSLTKGVEKKILSEEEYRKIVSIDIERYIKIRKLYLSHYIDTIGKGVNKCIN